MNNIVKVIHIEIRNSKDMKLDKIYFKDMVVYHY